MRIGKRYLKYEMMRVIDFLVRDRALGALAPPLGVVVERVEAVPTDVDGLHAAVCEDKPFLLRRDHSFLDWRYVQNPARGDYGLWTARGGCAA